MKPAPGLVLLGAWLAACTAAPSSALVPAVPEHSLAITWRATDGRVLAAGLQAALSKNLVFVRRDGGHEVRLQGRATDSGPLPDGDYELFLVVPGARAREIAALAVTPKVSSIELTLPLALRLLRLHVTGGVPANARLIARHESGARTEVAGGTERERELLLPPGPCALELRVPTAQGEETFTRLVDVGEADVQESSWEVARDGKA